MGSILRRCTVAMSGLEAHGVPDSATTSTTRRRSVARGTRPRGGGGPAIGVAWRDDAARHARRKRLPLHTPDRSGRRRPPELEGVAADGLSLGPLQLARCPCIPPLP